MSAGIYFEMEQKFYIRDKSTEDLPFIIHLSGNFVITDQLSFQIKHLMMRVITKMQGVFEKEQLSTMRKNSTCMYKLRLKL